MTWRVGGIAAVLVAVVAAVAVVFGGHHAGALDPVANAADATAQAGSAEVGIAATVTAAGQTIPLTGSGTVDMRNHSGRLSMSTTAAKAGAMTFDEILNGTTFYIRMPQLANRLPGGKQWLKIDLQAFGKTKGIDFGKVMQSGNNNPADLLRFLKAAGNSRVVGREDIRGTPTTHYTASIDLAKAADRIGDKQTADSLKALYAQSGATTMPLDVWIDRVGRVRREHFSFSMSAGGSPGSMDMTLEFIRFGVPVDATPPPGDQVLDAAALAGAAGG